MKAPVIIGILILVAASIIAGSEVQFAYGKFAALILAAAVVTAFLYSELTRREGVMANGEEEAIEVKGFGLEGRVRGRKLIGENTLLLIFICAIGYFGYMHHNDNAAQLQKIYEATVENTFVLSLSQVEREKLNIAMPESLRRKLRRE